MLLAPEEVIWLCLTQLRLAQKLAPRHQAVDYQVLTCHWTSHRLVLGK